MEFKKNNLLIPLSQIGQRLTDNWGFVWPLEFESVPFDVKRVFLVGNDSLSLERGNHAHKTCYQLVICIQGEVSIHLVNSSGLKFEVDLDENSENCLLIPPMTWGTQIYKDPFSKLLVLASHTFDENDYIRDFNNFISP